MNSECSKLCKSKNRRDVHQHATQPCMKVQEVYGSSELMVKAPVLKTSRRKTLRRRSPSFSPRSCPGICVKASLAKPEAERMSQTPQAQGRRKRGSFSIPAVQQRLFTAASQSCTDVCKEDLSENAATEESQTPQSIVRQKRGRLSSRRRQQRSLSFTPGSHTEDLQKPGWLSKGNGKLVPSLFSPFRVQNKATGGGTSKWKISTDQDSRVTSVIHSGDSDNSNVGKNLFSKTSSQENLNNHWGNHEWMANQLSGTGSPGTCSPRWGSAPTIGSQGPPPATVPRWQSVPAYAQGVAPSTMCQNPSYLQPGSVQAPNGCRSASMQVQVPGSWNWGECASGQGQNGWGSRPSMTNQTESGALLSENWQDPFNACSTRKSNFPGIEPVYVDVQQQTDETRCTDSQPKARSKALITIIEGTKLLAGLVGMGCLLDSSDLNQKLPPADPQQDVKETQSGSARNTSMFYKDNESLPRQEWQNSSKAVTFQDPQPCRPPDYTAYEQMGSPYAGIKYPSLFQTYSVPTFPPYYEENMLSKQTSCPQSTHCSTQPFNKSFAQPSNMQSKVNFDQWSRGTLQNSRPQSISPTQRLTRSSHAPRGQSITLQNQPPPGMKQSWQSPLTSDQNRRSAARSTQGFQTSSLSQPNRKSTGAMQSYQSQPLSNLSRRSPRSSQVYQAQPMAQPDQQRCGQAQFPHAQSMSIANTGSQTPYRSAPAQSFLDSNQQPINALQSFQANSMVAPIIPPSVSFQLPVSDPNQMCEQFPSFGQQSMAEFNNEIRPSSGPLWGQNEQSYTQEPQSFYHPFSQRLNQNRSPNTSQAQFAQRQPTGGSVRQSRHQTMKSQPTIQTQDGGEPLQEVMNFLQCQREQPTEDLQQNNQQAMTSMSTHPYQQNNGSVQAQNELYLPQFTQSQQHPVSFVQPFSQQVEPSPSQPFEQAITSRTTGCVPPFSQQFMPNQSQPY